MQYTGIGLDMSCKIHTKHLFSVLSTKLAFSTEYLSTQNHVSWYVFMLILTYRPYWK